MEQADISLADAIVFISRTSIRPMLRQELKTAGIEKIHSVETVEQVLDTLRRMPHALLVLDWEHGARVVNDVLRAAQGRFKVDTRPIFLIAAEVSLAVVATGTEYNVARVHAGEISRAALLTHLRAIVDEEVGGGGLRGSLTEVAELRAAGRLAEASRLLADLDRRFPDNRRITCELADNLIDENRWAEAQTVLSALTVMDKTNLRAQHLMARCHMKAGRYKEAAQSLEAGNIINPHNVERLVDLGNALMRIDRIREAVGNFEAALLIDTTHAGAKRGKAQCQLLEGDVNEALAMLRQLGSERELASVFNDAAILSIRAGRFDAGVSLYRAAIGAIGPREQVLSRLVYNLGIAYHKSRREDDALECFERAMAMDAHFDKCKHNARVLAARLGRTSATAHAQAEAFETEEEEEVLQKF